MSDDKMNIIGQNLHGFQSALQQSGFSLQEYLEKYYYQKWMTDELYAAMSLRTTFVNAIQQFLTNQGLLNLEKLQLSLLTDPLAHDVESLPTISYKGQLYVTTHSMIYAKFLACYNKKIKGIFVDSPNIRLEIESPDRKQRGKYLVDFSQMDIEIRRNQYVDLATYLIDHGKVKEILEHDMERAFDFFEKMIILAMSQLIEKNYNDLKTLGVTLEIPNQPFPRFKCDIAKNRFGRDYEIKLGEGIKEQFFWIIGLMRENYDLIYPYITHKGKIPLSQVSSDMIYNYDICAKSILQDTGKHTPALEIFSGAIREWIYEAIVERLLDNNIIPSRPVFSNGNITNIDELGGYGPFLMIASMRDNQGKLIFPETFGGGIGIERTIFALSRGPKIAKIDDITCFGKNPDSHQIYLF